MKNDINDRVIDIRLKKTSRILLGIPTAHAYQTTKKTITRLVAQKGISFDILVVDNASSDAKKLARHVPQLNYCVLTENTGSSGAQHVVATMGIRYKYDLVIFSDNDAIMLDPQGIRKLCEYLDAHPAVAAVLPHNIDYGKTPRNKPLVRSSSAFHYLVVRRSTLEAIPLTFKNLFLYSDDFALSSCLASRGPIHVLPWVSYYHRILTEKMFDNDYTYYYLRGMLHNAVFSPGIPLRNRMLAGVMVLYRMIQGIFHAARWRDGSYIITMYEALRDSVRLPMRKTPISPARYTFVESVEQETRPDHTQRSATLLRQKFPFIIPHNVKYWSRYLKKYVYFDRVMRRTPMEKPRILIVLNGIIGDNPPLSGGDIRPLEMAHIWEREGFDIHILSSESAQKITKHFPIHPTFHIMPNLGKKSAKWHFVLRAMQAGFSLPQSVRSTTFSIVYSANDTLFDVVPAVYLKITKRAKRFIAVVHWLPPFPPWKRKRSSLLSSTLFFISQRASLSLARMFSDQILAVSKSTAHQIFQAGVNQNKVMNVSCGVSYRNITDIAKKIGEEKIFDAVFMKRIQSVKGALDLVQIWKTVCTIHPAAKLLILGTGAGDLDMLTREIQSAGLTKNITCGGYVRSFEKKITYLSQSRLFILPSYEENWAIVVGEAMASGLPVVAYDLPELRAVWKQNILYTPCGNPQAMGRAIGALLSHPAKQRTMGTRNQRFVKQYDWEEIAQTESDVFKKMI